MYKSKLFISLCIIHVLYIDIFFYYFLHILCLSMSACLSVYMCLLNPQLPFLSPSNLVQLAGVENLWEFYDQIRKIGNK